jgi:3-methyladenine DNA glycosylase AlkD
MNYLEKAQKVFTAQSNQELAEGMSKYMRYLFPYLGLKKPLRASLTKDFFAQHALPKIDEWEDVVKELYALEEREYQYLAMDICEKMKKHWTIGTLDLFEWMILNKSWWDSVDSIASKLVGHYFKKFPDHKREITSAWNEHENFWLRRSSIIFQLSYKEQTDEKLLFAHCLNCIHEQEFFIRKAIGWALRQHARINPNAVKYFVNNHPFSNLSKREALKHLS